MPGNSFPQKDFDAKFARVFEAAECRTQVQLAEILGIRQSSISDAKRRKTIPADWLLKLQDKKHINPKWICTGGGNKFMPFALDGDIRKPTIINIVKYRPVQDCTTEELLTELIRRTLKNLE